MLPSNALNYFDAARYESVDVRVRVLDDSIFTKSYPADTALSKVKADVLDGMPQAVLRFTGSREDALADRMCLQWAGSQPDESRTLQSLWRFRHLPSRSMLFSLVPPPVCHAPGRDVVVVVDSSGRELRLRRVQSGAYVLLHPAAGLAAGLPVEVVGLISSHMPRGATSPSVHSLMCAAAKGQRPPLGD